MSRLFLHYEYTTVQYIIPKCVLCSYHSTCTNLMYCTVRVLCSNLHEPMPPPDEQYVAARQFSTSAMNAMHGAAGDAAFGSRRTSVSGHSLSMVPSPFVGPVIDQLDTLNDTVSSLCYCTTTTTYSLVSISMNCTVDVAYVNDYCNIASFN